MGRSFIDLTCLKKHVRIKRTETRRTNEKCFVAQNIFQTFVQCAVSRSFTAKCGYVISFIKGQKYLSRVHFVEHKILRKLVPLSPL